ncbi:MAG: hypothetical protein NTU95_11375 [Methanothrix sp.]|nr:hypothetical protein [Methanothrix sp.]
MCQLLYNYCVILAEEDKERLLAAVSSLGFQIVGPEKRHERISYDFSLSEAIWKPYYLRN